MYLIFSHGSQSHPRGQKIMALSKIAHHHGYQSESIDYQDLADPDQRVERLLNNQIIQTQAASKIVLVGSSMGGYVSAVVAERIKLKGLFLLAPAIYVDGLGVHQQQFMSKTKKISIVHGLDDQVIPYQNSIIFAKENRASVHLLCSDHPLTSALPDIEIIFTNFLTSLD